eukprot:c7450_g1_i1.p1 GENE.c7450_g1_i1~~c7450_g1_i1.p1  ORF type:complete len:431 (-),score=82.77 c7450_g1_i1:281-1528(-)
MRYGEISEIVFTTLVTLLMFSMKVPLKPTWKGTLSNVAFWVYVWFWIKGVGTIIRIPVHYEHYLSVDAVTLWFNWSGSVIVTLSTVAPAQLYFHYRFKGEFTRVPQMDRFWFCLIVTVVHCIAFIITCVLIAVETATVQTLLLAWRVFFYVNVALEMMFMILCLYLISRISSIQKKRFVGLRRHLLITLYMRAGLCSAIGLKLSHKLPKDLVASLHLFFLLTGLLGYHLRTIEKISGIAFIVDALKRAQVLMIDQALIRADPSEKLNKQPSVRDSTARINSGGNHTSHPVASWNTSSGNAIDRPSDSNRNSPSSSKPVVRYPSDPVFGPSAMSEQQQQQVVQEDSIPRQIELQANGPLSNVGDGVPALNPNLAHASDLVHNDNDTLLESASNTSTIRSPNTHDSQLIALVEQNKV